MKKYIAVVVGCGGIGIEESILKKNLKPSSHAGGFWAHPRTTLSALVDVDEEKRKRAKKLFPTVSCFKSTSEMLDKIKPEIVSVATPTESHLKVVREISQFGVKAIVCEKPISLDRKDAKKIVDLCKEKKISLIVNYSRLFDETIREVKADLGGFGPIVSGNAHYARGIYNGGSHFISLLRYYFGEVDRVIGFRNKSTENWKDLKNDLNIDGIIFFKSGVNISINSLDSNKYNIFDIFLYGKSGMISLVNFGYEVRYQKPEVSQFFSKVRTLGEIRFRKFVKKSMILSMIDNVIESIEKKGRIKSDGKEAMRTLAVCEALEKSSKDNLIRRVNE